MSDKQKRILIVDDESPIRRVLHQKLSKEGYRCEEANSAEQAMHWLTGNTAEVVILDIETPGRSGTEVQKEIKARYPDTSVIVTADVNEGSIAIQCVTQGADDYIFKPFKLDEVLLSVERALEKRKLEAKIKKYQQRLRGEADWQTAGMRQRFLGTIEALVFALEAKDKYTAGHSQRVTSMALAIGKELALSAEELEDLRCSSLLHDVGKIAVDQLIQNKPGRLTPEEYEHIMIHAHLGAGIVRPVVNEAVVEIIDHHHDHYDGSGLHQAVAGETIPLGARILAVADAFDAMTSERAYRAAMTIPEATREIKRCAGTQFDPAVVKAFLKMAKSTS
ncbi:MAG TPA: response regulator [Dehalococcoidia bacterium]|nr:response regulator [Dehalococcoidia bacterium]